MYFYAFKIVNFSTLQVFSQVEFLDQIWHQKIIKDERAREHLLDNHPCKLAMHRWDRSPLRTQYIPWPLGFEHNLYPLGHSRKPQPKKGKSSWISKIQNVTHLYSSPIFVRKSNFSKSIQFKCLNFRAKSQIEIPWILEF